MTNLVETLAHLGVDAIPLEEAQAVVAGESSPETESRLAPVVRKSLFDGKVTLEVNPAERGKVKLTARNCTSVLHRDVLSLDKSEDRAKFVRQLELSDEEKSQVMRALIELGDEVDQLPALSEPEPALDTRRAIFSALPDGRLIEQIGGGVFAVYSPESGKVAYQREVKTDGVLYCPLDDDFVLRGGLRLPEKLAEYGDDAELDAEIATVISRYSDVPARELKLSAKYVRLSYVADKLQEISYFRATGGPGSGKSRYICTTGMLCLRPILVTSPSAASLYRMMDAYQPTLIIDECNFEKGSEDSTALMQVLNAGFQRLTCVSRMERSGDGRMTLRMFSAFGPKLIGSLKLSDSPAFESRCVAVTLKKTDRKDIPFRMTEQMLRDFEGVREKLYLWRLRNWHRDYEQAFDLAEQDLKTYAIEPRFIQIAIPLYGMIEDPQLKKDFAQMLETRTEDAADDRKDSFDGQLVTIIHGLLFQVDGEGEERTASWRSNDGLFEREEGKPLEATTIERITEEVNADQPENRKHDSRWVGKQVVKVGFKRKDITSRQSKNRKKSAVVFDRQAFLNVFGNFNLPLPPDLHPATSGQSDKPNENKGLDWPDEKKNSDADFISSGQPNQLKSQELPDWPDVAGCKSPETTPEQDLEVF